MKRLLALAALLLSLALLGCGGSPPIQDPTAEGASPGVTSPMPLGTPSFGTPSQSPSPLSQKGQIEAYLADLKRIQDRDAPEPNKVIAALNALSSSPSSDWTKVEKSFKKLAKFYDKASVDTAVLEVPASMTKANRLGVGCMRLMYEFTADAANLLHAKDLSL